MEKPNSSTKILQKNSKQWKTMERMGERNDDPEQPRKMLRRPESANQEKRGRVSFAKSPVIKKQPLDFNFMRREKEMEREIDVENDVDQDELINKVNQLVL